MAPLTPATTIVIVDDHAIFCEGLKMLIESQPEMRVVATAGNIPDACEVIGRFLPDLVLLDIDLDAVSSIDHLESIIACSPQSKILMLTDSLDADTNRAAEIGAVGVITKNDAPSTLIMAIRKVNSGEVWFDRAFTAQVMRNMSRRNTAERKTYSVLLRLTSREYEIAMKIGQGLVNKDIAHELGISEKTVRNCLTTIYDKLGVTGRLELALFLSKNQQTAG